MCEVGKWVATIAVRCSGYREGVARDVACCARHWVLNHYRLEHMVGIWLDCWLAGQRHGDEFHCLVLLALVYYPVGTLLIPYLMEFFGSNILGLGNGIHHVKIYTEGREPLNLGCHTDHFFEGRTSRWRRHWLCSFSQPLLCPLSDFIISNTRIILTYFLSWKRAAMEFFHSCHILLFASVFPS